MSHFTSVQTRIMDLECLELSLNQLDYKVIHKARMRGWQNQQKEVSLVAQFKNSCPYDIGFVKNQKTGAYAIEADWWAIHEHLGLEEEFLVHQISQSYAYHKVVKEVKQRGFVIAQEKKDADQSIRLLVRKW
ncbi:hypothetical protein COW36_03940 [bacterium (Candidatus Blackallbacteria) CG17_big_fil_post_rev_8_21_14_2_50_48_46]|uniref:DUF1257 domain-containing protein n=1 Tax=bacterium (Candidatus Blackallbacteria) CG17_big_fil_post_rev_8_21_14_2_50_48_46 TaxID=2014261 RepID=A0A2M7G8M0_9BACT|nr:MAG: hypothetical protein COW64_05005 [bacterium (Candidatus Blackallbacteria) CG18_big_fil_WC_8_21_14_2_50_49_26]PIW18450.1 MAG: hypothetical protein COW36_03940 [bacterium (Candidatus Blackallbacteria) CG17_big_fil_post_rev_8_21_14_2_50_48_46]PIW46565.1 MAG: hypothetical protein COW20_16740 [bacterium (Candidatus Blackallbacteria) CG13_big_fil_rev_8_21_14_2_50_49_14]